MLGIILGWAANNTFQKRRIEILESTIQSKDQEIKILDRKIKDLSDSNEVDNKDFSKRIEDCPPLLAIHLTPLEVSAILKIYKFEIENSPKANQEYSFEDLMKDLNISYSEANAVIDKFRRFGLFSSPWDSVLQFPNLNRPINESKPGRLTQEGIDIAIRCQRTNQHK